MKGHMEDGKFHPHTEHKKGVRKSRDQTAKTQGVNVSKLKFAEKGSGKGFDGLGRKEPVKIARVGEIGKVSFGSGIDSGKIGKVVGIKKANEIPISSSDWFQIKVIKPDIQKGIIIQVPKGRVEAVTGERKARDLPDPILETQLDDIFDDVRQTDPEYIKLYGDKHIDDSKLTKAVGENIKFILKREKKLPNDQHISIGNINFREETKDETGHYQYDYSVWKNEPLELTNRGGTAYGMISNGTLIDMNLELYNTDDLK